MMGLTRGGEVGDRIFKHSSRMPQVYWLTVAGRLRDDEMQQIRLQAHARLRRLRAPGAAGSEPANPWYEVELSDTRRDLLRRTLFALGHPVEKMKRVKLGPLELDDLAEGHYRRLEPREGPQFPRFFEHTPRPTPATPTNPAPRDRRRPRRQQRRPAR